MWLEKNELTVSVHHAIIFLSGMLFGYGCHLIWERIKKRVVAKSYTFKRSRQ